MSFARNTAYPIPFGLINSTTGGTLTGATVTAKRILDGGLQESAGGSIVERGGGQYLFNGSATDFNAIYTVGLLFTATGAIPAHVLIQMQRFRKNTAYDIPFLLLSVNNGSGLTGASPAGKRILDGGAQASVSGTFVERGLGQYVFQGDAADFNGDDTAGFLFTASGAIPRNVIVDLEPELVSSGNTLKMKIYDTLAADAQINDPNNLGGMLGLYSAEPYGIYFRNPPTGQDFNHYSILTYFVASMSGRFPREIYLAVTAWGKNFEDILNRCHSLLHDFKISTSDYRTIMVKWDQGMTEQWADDLKVYFQQHRYLIKGIKL